MNLRPILYIVGLLLLVLAASMIAPIATDLIYGHSDWQIFLGCMIATAFCGGLLVINNHQHHFQISIRQAFLLTALSWVSLSLFAAIPFYFAHEGLSATDAVFEAVSGITTTGATILPNVSAEPPGILLWRAMLQWLGGIGIIVMALSVMPMMRIGGMQLFQSESSENEKALPRVRQLAASIVWIYLGLSVACTICYTWAGMNFFNSVAHAMTTIATGGYSTFNNSFYNMDSIGPEWVATIFMFMGGLPFILYFKALSGNPIAIFKDEQVRWYVAILSGSIITLSIYLFFQTDWSFIQIFTKTAFNIVSIMTGTGFASSSYDQWGSFALPFFFILMCIGGCAGSTSCGIKIFRFQILYEVSAMQLKQLAYPRGVFNARYNGKPITADIFLSVLSFFFLFALSFTVIAVLLGLTGLDFITAMSAAVSAISNVGPGLGEVIGPASTYTSLPDPSKWILCFGMLLGRLELFTILILFTPYFWREA